jgi:RNA polymerase sigma-70 factor (ECF subfamily)
MSTPPTGDPAPGDDASARLAALWDAHAVRVQAYALRHTDPDTAQDVLSETFLVAWRRIDDVPEPALPWLLVVARNLVRNAERAQRRRRVLTDELTYLQAAAPLPDGAPEALATERDALLRGLAALTDREREAVLLVAWDGLSPAAAAKVAGCTLATFHVRLHRARRRLAASADHVPSADHARDARPDSARTSTTRRSA